MTDHSGPVPYRTLLNQEALWDFVVLRRKQDLTVEEMERLGFLCHLMAERYRPEA